MHIFRCSQLSIWFCLSVGVCVVCVMCAVSPLLYAHNFSLTIFFIINKKKKHPVASSTPFTTCTLCAVSKTRAHLRAFPFHFEAIAERTDCNVWNCTRTKIIIKTTEQFPDEFICSSILTTVRMCCWCKVQHQEIRISHSVICQWAHKNVSRKKGERKRTSAGTRGGGIIKNHHVDLVDSREKPYPMALSHNCLNISRWNFLKGLQASK